MMNVEVLVYPQEKDWEFCKLCALTTVGKTHVVNMPDAEWRYKMLRARHSPIRTLMFGIRINPIPSWMATHYARHKHLEPFVSTQRNDRQDKYDRNAARQDAPVMEILWLNAEELMTLANKRLCGCCDNETRLQTREICEAVIQVCPEMQPFLVPFCMEYGCHEFKACGSPESYLPFS